jgi:hypothetical protein
MMEDAENPLDQIVDVRVISPGRSVSKDRDLFSLVDHPGEFMNGHIRSLPGTVSGENPEAGDIHSIEMMIGIAEEFTRPFGGSVRGDGLDVEILLRERDSLIFSINRGGRREGNVFDPRFFATFQEGKGSPDVYILIEQRLFNGGPYPGTGSQVDDEVNFFLSE